MPPLLGTLVACRLSPALVEQAQRHADLYHSSVSRLLREGLEYRLTCPTWPPERPDTPQVLPTQVSALLEGLTRHLMQVQAELGRLTGEDITVYNGYTSSEDTRESVENAVKYNGYTSEDTPAAFSGHVARDTTPENAADCDTVPEYNRITLAHEGEPSTGIGAEEEGASNGITMGQAPPQALAGAEVPAFDPAKYVLSRTLCPQGHAYAGTGRTLLRLPKRICPQCDAARARAKRQAQRQTRSARQ